MSWRTVSANRCPGCRIIFHLVRCVVKCANKVSYYGIVFATLTNFASAAPRVSGTLDNTFGDNGYRIVDLGDDDRAYAVGIKPNGHIIGVGQSRYAIGIVSIDQAGAPTVLFNDKEHDTYGGRFKERYIDRPRAGLVQDDGGIVVAGSIQFSGSLPRTADLLRFYLNPPSSTSLELHVYAKNDQLLAIERGDKGVLAAAGYFASASRARDFLIVKTTSNLKVASTFNKSGRRILDLGGDEMANAIHIDRKGRMIAAGKSNRQGTYDFALVRLFSNGKLDPHFGQEGVVFTDISGGIDEARALVEQSDGKYVVAGLATRHGERHVALVRYHADGTIDNSFGDNGMTISDADGYNEEAYAMVLQPDGRLIVAGRSNLKGSDDFFLIRFLRNGRPDVNFGKQSRILTDLGGTDVVRALALQPDGKLIAAGFSNGTGNNDFAFARYNLEAE